MPNLPIVNIETQASPTFLPLSRLMEGSLTRNTEMAKTLQDVRLS